MPVLLVIAACLASGTLASVQARMNGELSRRLGEPVEAALWSFGSGLLLLTLVGLGSSRMRAGARRVWVGLRAGRIRWYQCLGGMLGGFFVAVQSYAVPLVGIAVFTVAIVAGQVGNALVVDRFGIGPAGVQRVGSGRVVAAVLALLGVVVAVSDRLGGAQLAVAAVVAALLAGGGSSLQAGINGRVNVASRLPLATTWINFGFGTAFLVALAVGRGLGGGLRLAAPHGIPVWAWFGGACGIGFIAIAAWAVHHVGVLVYGLAMLAGQLGSALALDLLSPATRATIGPAVLAGVAMTFVSAGLGSALALRARRPRGAAGYGP